MYDRVNYASFLKTKKGAIITAIDENEVFNLMKMYDVLCPEWNKTVVTVLHNPAGVQGDNFSYSHEYAVFMFENSKNIIGKTTLEKQSTEPFRDWGPSGTRNPNGNTFYPILVDLEGERIIGFGEACGHDFHPSSQNVVKENHIEVYPIGDEGDERKWVFARETVEEIADELSVSKNNGMVQIMRTKSKGSYKTVWNDSLYYANIYGSKLLNNIIGKKEFDFPKSVHTVKDCIYSINQVQKGNCYVLDYFAGSGTTGHSTIKLNRDDQGGRKYILIEMGTYFNTVTKPRIQKVIYSDNWKNGKPQDKAGISQIVKYQVLESYEDTLNNLYLENKTELDFTGKAKEEYVLQYMLELESRDHLFNLQMFRKPFDYQLKVTENNELKPTKVDLVETFNYLIGLYVSKVQRVKDIKVLEGTTRTGIKTLVIWRDLDTTTHDEVEKLLRRFYDSQRTKEFQQIYINGDHHLENLRSEGDSFKIKLIEETFFKKMFNETEL
jgi:adenine-specific DNA-methyltransferase